MTGAASRRVFLRALLTTAAAVAARRAGAAESPLMAVRLHPRVLHVSGAGGNVVVVESGDGLLMVNGGRRDRSAELLTLVANQCGGTRVTTLFNTDWHPDHTGSNETLAAGGARILAHEHTKEYLSVDLVDCEGVKHLPLPPRALPTETFLTSGTLAFGGENVEYRYLGQAHTDGDIAVWLPAANVLIAGDVLTVGRYPVPDYTTGGWLGGLMTATKTLLDLTNADTRIVPGTGPVQTRADLQAQFDMLTTLRDRLPKMMRQGMSAEEMLAAGATQEFDARWGSPDRFVPTVYRGLWLHVRELGGIV